MTISRLFLFIIILLSLFILPSSAFMETFEYHPYADVELSWDNDTYNYGAEPWVFAHDHLFDGSGAVSILYNDEFKTNASCISASAYRATGTAAQAWSWSYIKNYEVMDTSFFSAKIDAELYIGSLAGDRNGAVYIDVYDTEGNGPITMTLWSASGSSGPVTYYMDSGLYEIKIISNNLYLIINGTSQGIQGAWGSNNIGYVRFRSYSYTEPAARTVVMYMYVDDISTSGNVVGINADRTPNSDNTHYMTHTELDLDDQPDYEVNASYTFNTLTSSPTDAQYQMKIRRIYDGSIVNTTTIKDAGTAWSDDTPPFGTILYNRTDIFGENFGMYQFFTTKDGTLQSYDLVNWQYTSLSGNSWVDIPDTISSNAEIDIDYYIDTPEFGDYNYYIKVFDPDYTVTQSYLITTDSGTEILDTSGYNPGVYLVIMTAVAKNDGASFDIAYDMTTISTEIIVVGTTYNATNNSIIPAVYINDSQGSTWFNTTSDGTGDYELQGFSSSNETDINASKTNYTHEDFTWTPLQVGYYTMDLYLFPTNISRTTAAIEGMVVSYPFYQGIGNATVNIYNDTWSNTTTATSWGYYVFDNLSVDNSTITNETFNSSDYDTWVTLNYNDLLSGTILVSNLTDETPFILNSDYEMNYTDGSIKVLSAGNMTNWTNYHIDYDYYIPTTYHVNASYTGTEGLYENSVEYDVIITNSTWSIQNILLHPIYTLTVTAEDTETTASIFEFTAVVDGTTISTTNGTISFTPLDYGLYTIGVSASGYYPNTAQVLLNKNKSVEVSLTPIDSVYYQPHYVKFTVQNIWGTKYSGVDVSVYKGTDTTTSFTGTTGSDGSVTFKLSETTSYRITFINATAGISETRTLYPVDTHYYIIVSSTLGSWDTYDIPISDAIDFTISKSIINSTHAYINVSYNDSQAETTDLKVYLNQTNESDYFNQTNLDTWNAGATSSGSHSFIVEDYAGQAYIIHLLAEHTTYGTIDSTYSVSFKDDIAGKFPGIPPSVWLYGSIFILLFFGGIFTVSNCERGMLLVCIMFFIFYGLGTFASLPSNVQQSMLAGGILGFILSVIANLNKANREEGFT